MQHCKLLSETFAQYSTISLNRSWRYEYNLFHLFIGSYVIMHRVVNGECFSLTGMKTCSKPSVFPFPTHPSHLTGDNAQCRKRLVRKQQTLFMRPVTGYVAIPCHLQHTLHFLYHFASFHPSHTPMQCDWCKVGEREWKRAGMCLNYAPKWAWLKASPSNTSHRYRELKSELRICSCI